MKKLFTKTLAILAMLAMTISANAKQYCGEEMTLSGSAKIQLSCIKVSDGNYQIIIEGENLNGLGGSFYNPGAKELRTAITTNTSTKIVCDIAAESAPSLYTPLYVLCPGEQNVSWPNDIEWGVCGSGDAKTASELSINATEKTLDATNSETFQIVATTAQGYDGTVTYASSKDGIATVSASGLVTAAGRGTATITVTAPETENFAASTKKLTVTVTGPINWEGVDWLAGSDNKYKVVVDPVIPSQFGGMSKQGDDLYIGFPSAAFGEMSIEPSAGEGAWKKFALSNFPAKENQFTVVCDNKTYTFDVYYADGKDVVEIYDTNFALASNGASAVASHVEGTSSAAAAIDGNNGTSWESKHGVDAVTLTVDMGKLRIFNTIQLRWQTAYGKHFTIDVSNDNAAWRTVKEVNETLSGFPYEQIIELAANDTARYIRFSGIERGTEYGYNLYEFRVLLPSVPVLTTLNLTAAAYSKVGVGVNLTIVSKDQIGRNMDVDVEYTVSPADAGAVVDGVYTPAKAGAATITATAEELSSTVSVFGLISTENLALNKTVVAGYEPANAGEKSVKVVDGNDDTEWTTWQNQPATKEWLYIDLGGRYNLEAIQVVWGANHSTSYILQVRSDAPSAEQAANDEAWTTIATINDAVASASKVTATDAEKVQYVRIHSLTRQSVDLIRLKEIRVFGTEWVDEGDTKVPVMGEAELVSSTWESAVITVSATDEDGEVVSYHVVENAHSIDLNLNPVVDKITVTGLEGETTYNLVITAIDGAGHESQNSANVEVTTPIDTSIPLEHAPVPSASGKEVRPIYSDAFESILAHPFDKDGFAGVVLMLEKDIDGDKCLVYNINGNAEVTWGMYDDGANAIIAQEAYRGTGMGIDASAMEKLHIDIWSLQAFTDKFNININDAALKTLRLSHNGEGWQSYDIDLSEFAEGEAGKKIDNVRWMKFNGLSSITGKMALDNVYFYKEAEIPSSIDNTEIDAKAQKVIENGVLYIVREGVRYNVMGAKVK